MILEKLFKMQHELDEHIVFKKELEGQNLLQQKILALQVELGELANETRCFKFWSNKGPSSKEVILEEYVDCLHFLLSIGIDIKMDHLAITSHNYFLTEPIVETFITLIGNIELLKIKNYRKPAYDLCFKQFIRLGKMLNFTWEEIVQAYKEKNKINHDRQENGY